MDKLKLTVIILACALAITMCYIIIEKAPFCETTKNESYSLGYNLGSEKGFNQGYYNGSRDYVIALNQRKVFPCLDFQTKEYEEKHIGGLCEK